KLSARQGDDRRWSGWFHRSVSILYVCPSIWKLDVWLWHGHRCCCLYLFIRPCRDPKRNYKTRCVGVLRRLSTMKKSPGIRTETLVKLFIYVALIALAISIVIPVAWVFMASIKENEAFYKNPWLLPEGFHWQNFIEAFRDAKMGD